jgi:heat shock protein beta
LFTDDEVVKREEEAIKLDGLNVAQIKELRDKAEKFSFQAEVNRMMKLIINSLYRNKEVSSQETLASLAKCISCKVVHYVVFGSQLKDLHELISITFMFIFY